jgi:hypothetical protein
MCDVDLLVYSVTNETGRTEFSIVCGFYDGNWGFFLYEIDRK